MNVMHLLGWIMSCFVFFSCCPFFSLCGFVGNCLHNLLYIALLSTDQVLTSCWHCSLNYYSLKGIFKNVVSTIFSIHNTVRWKALLRQSLNWVLLCCSVYGKAVGRHVNESCWIIEVKCTLFWQFNGPASYTWHCRRECKTYVTSHACAGRHV